MANVLVERTSLEDTAGAIRAKLKSQDLIAPEDFAENILQIPGGGGEEYIAPYGNLEYYYYETDWNLTDNTYGYEGTFEATFDRETFEYFIEMFNPALESSITFRWNSSEGGGDDTWWVEFEDKEYQYHNEQIGLDEDLEQYGISVSWTLTEEWERKWQGIIDIRHETTVDKTQLAGVKYINTLKEWQNMGPEWKEGMSYYVYFGEIPTAAVKSFVAGPSIPWVPDSFMSSTSIERFDGSRINASSFSQTNFPQAFLYGCNDLTEAIVVIPSGVTRINKNFMRGCSNVEDFSIILPNTVTTIDESFCNNTGTSKTPIQVTIPSSVTTFTNQNNSYFMYGVKAGSSVTTNTDVSPKDNYSLASGLNANIIYGSGRASWLANLPNRTSYPTRTLVDGGA